MASSLTSSKILSAAPAPVASLDRERKPLTRQELQRYGRHISIPEIGVAGQERIKAARILVIGAGGLGSPTLTYLAAAGVGILGVIDDDRVEESNLQRQIIHGQSSIGMLKVDSAKERLAQINPLVSVVTHDFRLDSSNAIDVFGQYDIVVDGSDNFVTRYLVNDACVLLGIPCVWGSIFQFHGQASVFWAENGPCYRCLYPEAPPAHLAPSCAEGGVLGALCATVASLQASEVIKLVVGYGTGLIGRLWTYNGKDVSTRTHAVLKDPDCAICGSQPTIRTLTEVEFACSAIGAGELDVATLTPEQLLTRLRRRDGGLEKFVLLDVREQYEYDIVHIDGAELCPKGALPGLIDALSPEAEVLVYCKSGARSLAAAIELQKSGIRVSNLDGGIMNWISVVDPSLPEY